MGQWVWLGEILDGVVGVVGEIMDGTVGVVGGDIGWGSGCG